MMPIIYKDANFLAISKPAGVLVHPTAHRNAEDVKKNGTVADWLLREFPEIAKVGDNPALRPGIVHRLDRETSGVLVIARNEEAFEYLKKLFQDKKIKKTYLALVWGELRESGTVDRPIGLKPGTTRRVTRGKGLKMVKDAVTEYRPVKVIEKDGEKFTLVELSPKTGRTHQLRVHMKSLEHPVVGDTLYGPKENPFGLKRQFLHASSLEFTAPDGSRLKLEADLPPELEKIIDSSF